MRRGRLYLLVLGLAGAVTMGPGIGHSQESVDSVAVNARATAVLADIQGRIGNAKSEDQKKCLGEKRAAVNAIKSRVAGSTDMSSLLSELNAIGGELDTCTGEKKESKSGDKAGEKGGTAAAGAGPAQVVVNVDEGTPDGDATNTSIVIAPGPTAANPGVIDNGSNGGGGDFGGGGGAGGGGDTGGTSGAPPPVVPPPPISPMI